MLWEITWCITIYLLIMVFEFLPVVAELKAFARWPQFSSLAHSLQIHRTRLPGLQQRLNALNPQSILKRGFALVRGSDGRLVKSVEQVHPGEDLQVRVSDGEFGARVREADGNPME